MAAITLAVAEAHLEAWLAADVALTQGQSYTINLGGTQRQLTRANASEVRNNIDYWGSKVERLSVGNGAPRVRRVVPRDV